MKKYRLTTEHPASKALNKAMQALEELDITIIQKHDGLAVMHNGRLYDLQDIDTKQQEQQFPTPVECMLTYWEED